MERKRRGREEGVSRMGWKEKEKKKRKWGGGGGAPASKLILFVVKVIVYEYGEFQPQIANNLSLDAPPPFTPSNNNLKPKR